ncbi:hypothetical protein LOY46_03215 [Pseudomonas sichuanensis]|uniref:hypothetical protein n=1 Tax=Pseudomonas sichuanensis TaxID=2213015 RepID=UPI0021609C4F|nr:hypothetical protein [Pseudomonas sichuanensis]UVK83736.1 hypothetical protein LOY46_03215 [Pseudomonas sichuanensis]
MNITRSTKPSFALPLVMFIILGLSGCIGPRVDEPLRPPPAPPQPSGVLDVAARLNARYANTVESCSNGGAALECSGVLIRRSSSSNFWVHSAAAAALGSVTFSYLRADATISRADASGFIFMDKQTAQQQGKSWAEPRCIYPFIAGTQNAGRPANGCGFAARAAADQSTCAGLAVPAVTPALWIENFQRFGSNPRNQCSLSTRDASQFMTSLKVRGSLASQASTLLNELLIPTWDVNTPERLPIEAFFYNAASPGSLITAQMLRHDYRVRTGLSLPIVTLDFAKPTGERFAQRAADQEDGWQVADRLNARFVDRSRQCADGRAPVYCNGVLARATQYSTAFHAWNPNPNTNPKDAVSFSYMRADVKTVKLFYPQGLIFDRLGYTSGPGLVAIEPLCIYMADANTWSRSTQGCGPGTDFPTDSKPCASMDINTLDALGTHFRKVPADPTWQRLHHQCSLAIQPASFMLAIDGRTQFIVGTENQFYGYNEIMLRAWAQNIPDSLPLDAIFYTSAGGTAALTQAKQIQQDLFRSSASLIKPVVRIDLSATGQAFSYRREDQGY